MDPLDLDSALREHYGFPAFRPGQRQAVARALAGRDALVVMPTGSGKSLCYQLPALLLTGTTLVISPLIALMKDQVDALVAARKRATFINSTLPAAEQQDRLARLKRGEYALVYLAPERLRNADLARALSGVKVALLAVDEAHCISQWGHDFRPDYLHLAPFIAQVGGPPVFALTATATPQVQDDIAHQLGDRDMERIVTGFNRPNLGLSVRHTPGEAAKLRELAVLLAGRPGSGIIYTGTRREAEQVAEFVNEVVHLRATHYHAGLDVAERTAAQEAFMSGALPVMVATNAFGMGVDKPDIRFVIHYSLPATVEAYYQEVGRAGRDGAPARGVLLYAPEDRALQEWFIEHDAPARAEVENLYRLLPRGFHPVSLLDLQRQIRLNDSKLKIALRQLERAGALTHVGDQHGALLLQVRAVAALDLTESGAEIDRFRAHKRTKLAQMIRYAETDACRRRFILDYFGDRGPADAPDCCDNHGAPVPLTPVAGEGTAAEATALTILECVRAMSGRIGRSGVAKILTASRAESIRRFERSPYFGRLAQFKRKQLDVMLSDLIARRYVKLVGSEYPVVALTPLGTEALQVRAAIPLAVSATRRSTHMARAERDLGTVGLTHQLIGQGVAPEEIARQRQIAVSTVYEHLAELIEQGLEHLDAVVPPEVQEPIRIALSQAESLNLSAIKARLPESVSYDVIRCVRAAHLLERNGPRQVKLTAQDQAAPLSDEDQVVFTALRALRMELAHACQVPPYGVLTDRSLAELARTRPQTIGELDAVFGIGPRKCAQYGARLLDLLRVHPRRGPDDAVAHFLAAARPKPLRGPWHTGFALDFNSQFAGARWERTELGDLVYRFKYGGQADVVATLGNRLAALIRERPELRPDLIVAIPCTHKERPYDPVPLLAQALGRETRVAVGAGVLVKTRVTELQKGLTNLTQKQANVRGAFRVADANSVRVRRILLLDDFYDTGATLGEATRVLLAAGAATVNVLTVTKTIRAD